MRAWPTGPRGAVSRIAPSQQISGVHDVSKEFFTFPTLGRWRLVGWRRPRNDTPIVSQLHDPWRVRRFTVQARDVPGGIRPEERNLLDPQSFVGEFPVALLGIAFDIAKVLHLRKSPDAFTPAAVRNFCVDKSVFARRIG